jgi:RNA polymerase sigma factor (sigma-70 family)
MAKTPRPVGLADASTTVVLDAARGGDNAAWEELVRRYGSLLRATIAPYRLTPTDAADAMQATWLRLLERAGTIHDPEKLGAWLITTTRRECLALIRRGRAETPTDVSQTDLAAPAPTPETMVIVDETRRLVRQATQELPGRPRAIIEALYYRPCLGYAHVARQTGMPIGSIGPTRARAMRCLRQRLRNRDS